VGCDWPSVVADTKSGGRLHEKAAFQDPCFCATTTPRATQEEWPKKANQNRRSNCMLPQPRDHHFLFAKPARPVPVWPLARCDGRPLEGLILGRTRMHLVETTAGDSQSTTGRAFLASRSSSACRAFCHRRLRPVVSFSNATSEDQGTCLPQKGRHLLVLVAPGE